jgi:hypothetical protein
MRAVQKLEEAIFRLCGRTAKAAAAAAKAVLPLYNY